MSITTGEFFTNILLAASPTALGRALANLPQTPQQWGIDLSNDIKAGATVEDPTVVAEYQSRLITYSQIFAALLQQVYVPNGTGGFTPVPLAKVLNDQIASLGKQANLLNVPWQNPPHPPGRYVWRLIDTLSGYDEQ